MLEAASYGVTLALFAFVIYASVRVEHDVLLLACIPPVFPASNIGFAMWIYACETLGLAMALIVVALPLPAAWKLCRCRRRGNSRGAIRPATW